VKRIFLIAALALVAVAAPAVGAAPVPSRLFVSAKEWSLVLSRQALKPGSVRIQLYDAGEDAHDLRLRRVGGKGTLTVTQATPGTVTELRAMLRPGRWKLWCSLPGHEARGMRATLVVKR
jgi:hypothetical protein